MTKEGWQVFQTLTYSNREQGMEAMVGPLIHTGK